MSSSTNRIPKHGTYCNGEIEDIAFTIIVFSIFRNQGYLPRKTREGMAQWFNPHFLSFVYFIFCVSFLCCRHIRVFVCLCFVLPPSVAKLDFVQFLFFGLVLSFRLISETRPRLIYIGLVVN